ncbi:hypothetical protein [Microbulbifer sp. SAOS-129_SWC]|uniref:hypothetical protein n=1 Tax=Microbulbifer sp. SAOS-129_SWC TaxID=3145235 RepID=UPI003216FF8F
MSIYNLYKIFFSVMIFVSFFSGLLFFPFFPYILVLLIPISLSIIQRKQRHGGILPRHSWNRAGIYLLFPLPFLATAAFVFGGIAYRALAIAQCDASLSCIVGGGIGVVIVGSLCCAIGLMIAEALLWNFSTVSGKGELAR